MTEYGSGSGGGHHLASSSNYHLLVEDLKTSSAAATTTTTISLGGFCSAFCGSINSWFRHYRIYKTVLLILLLLVLLPLFAHRSLLNVSRGNRSQHTHHRFFVLNLLFPFQPDNDVPQLDLHRQRPLLDAYEDFSSMRASDLKMRIEELLRIKVS